MASRIDPHLVNKLYSCKADQQVNLIIHPTSSMSLDQAAKLLQAADVRVRRTFTLTHSLAASASVDQVKQLTKQRWVAKVEEDRSIQTF